MDGEVFEHESYGLIRFGRISSNRGVPLFGSSIRHGEVIRLSVKRAEMIRDLHYDRHHGTDELIEVDMSLSQFVEAITSMNTSGVPCTLHAVNGQLMAECPYQSKREQFQTEFEADCKRFGEQIDHIEDTLNIVLTTKPNKGHIQNLLNQVRMLRQGIESNLPFIVTQFNEQMDNTVKEAKGEVEAFVQHKILSAGLEALQNSVPLVQIEDQREDFIEVDESTENGIVIEGEGYLTDEQVDRRS
jgi:hypothetical protein